MKTAKLVSKNASPVHAHDCCRCRFLGRLDGLDLYVCDGGVYTARHGSRAPEFGSLGDLTPPGTPYALARALNERGLPPAEYRTA